MIKWFYSGIEMNKVKKKLGYKVKYIVICYRIIKWYFIFGVLEYIFIGI